MADEIRLGNTKLSLKLATSKTKELVRAGIDGKKLFRNFSAGILGGIQEIIIWRLL